MIGASRGMVVSSLLQRHLFGACDNSTTDWALPDRMPGDQPRDSWDKRRRERQGCSPGWHPGDARAAPAPSSTTRQMTKRDIQNELKHLCQPSAKAVSVVEVPPMDFLMIDEQGLRRGRHHEIYLSDISRTAPENWKTIMRQLMA